MRQSNAVAHNGLHHTTRKPDRRPGGDTPTKNIWTPDSEVKVGYMTLRVVKRIPTPGDGKPDKWALTSLDGTRDYIFAPYSGLKKIADRRQPVSRVPRATQVAKQAIKNASTDHGKGRHQPVALARGPTQAERLDRLEALLLSVAERLEDTPPSRLRRAG